MERPAGKVLKGVGGGALVLGVIFLAPRRKNWVHSGLLLLLLTFSVNFVACSGSGGSSPTGGGGGTTPATTYTYTVTATQGSVTASTNFNVILTSN
jgi:hypothetical protein